jgi:hypothetical protein
MGLTKPRAAQIFNLDYKQSTRVVATATVNLAGGAPNQIDGVNLSLNDRILVTSQNTPSQNGLYLVDTVGSGANGTWIRTSDGNENGEIEAGMIVMVTEGTIYADTQWKLITDDPIVINTTALTFTQNYMANSISSGTSNVVVNSNANVTISSAGTANVLTISSTGTATLGISSTTGNVIGGNLTTAGNVTGGNLVTAGQANVGTLTVNGGSLFTGNLLPSANVTYNLGSPTQRWKEIFLAANTIDIGGALISADIATGSLILTGPDGAEFILTGTSPTDSFGIFGRIEAGNTESSISTTTGALTVAGGAGIGGNLHVGELFKATGNVEGGNLVTSSGNIIGNYLFANIAFATGYTASKIYNGISEANIGASGGNANISIGGTSNVVVVAATGQYVSGLLSVTGNIISGNISAANHTGTNVSVTGTVTANSVVGDIITGSSANVTGAVTASSVVGGIITGSSTSVTGTITAAGDILTQANVSVGGSIIVSSSISANGSIIANSNLFANAIVSAAGNVVGSNVYTGGQVSASGNITGGNLIAGAQVLATGNITGSNIVTAGQVLATGNVIGSTLIASGNIAVQSRQQVKFYDTDSSNFISLRAPNALTGDYLLTLPTGYGNADQVLSTNGAGSLVWADQSGGGSSSATSYPNSTVSPVPGSTGNFDLSFNFVQTSQEVPFESSATDAFGVNLGEVYSMMDPGGEVLEPVDLGPLT